MLVDGVGERGEGREGKWLLRPMMTDATAVL